MEDAWQHLPAGSEDAGDFIHSKSVLDVSPNFRPQDVTFFELIPRVHLLKGFQLLARDLSFAKSLLLLLLMMMMVMMMMVMMMMMMI